MQYSESNFEYSWSIFDYSESIARYDPVDGFSRDSAKKCKHLLRSLLENLVLYSFLCTFAHQN